MRRDAKLLANYLGSAKEITGRFIELAGITPGELNQIEHAVTKIRKAADRKALARMLAKKGLTTRPIADILGVHHSTIAEDLAVGNPTKIVGNPTAKKPSKTGGREDKRVEIAEAAAAEGITAVPTEKYRIFYADPAWDYGAHEQPDYQTEQRDHYPVMTVEAICAEPVKDWAEDNAVLFLWVTSPILARAFEVIQAWGFEYKASFVWDKIKHNMGHYNSVRHELLLICTRGSCQPDKQQLFDSVQSIERGRHSEKPVEFYDIIETIYTHGRRLEMYARKRRDGWDVYGHLKDLAEAAE